MTGLFVIGLIVGCGAAVDIARRESRRVRTRRRFDPHPLVLEVDNAPSRHHPAQERLEAWVRRAMRGRPALKAEADLPGVLEEIARGLRSGASLRQAITEAAPCAPGLLGEELAAVIAALARGVALVDALGQWETSAARTGVRLSAAALCLGAETGGAQARAVDGVATTLRERLAVASEVRALTSQTRASMLVIAASPIAFCAFASATDPRTSTFLFRTPVGLACLAAGIGLDVAGALWMRRLSRLPA